MPYSILIGNESARRRASRRSALSVLRNGWAKSRARREPEAVPGKCVDRRGGRAHSDAAPVTSEVTSPRRRRGSSEGSAGGPCVRGELLPRRLRLVGEDEGRFAMRGEADGRARNRIEGRHAVSMRTGVRIFCARCILSTSNPSRLAARDAAGEGISRHGRGTDLADGDLAVILGV
jgi:hypothetical protein